MTALSIHPGSGGVSKIAPLDFFIEEARRSNDSLFLLGPAESEHIENQLSEAHCAFRRSEKLSEMKNLIVQREAFLGNDSGPAHVAALAGLATRIVYTETDPELWKPPGNVTVSLRPSPATPVPPGHR